MKGGDKYEKHEQNRRNKQTRKHNILILTISNNPEKYKPNRIKEKNHEKYVYRM